MHYYSQNRQNVTNTAKIATPAPLERKWEKEKSEKKKIDFFYEKIQNLIPGFEPGTRERINIKIPRAYRYTISGLFGVVSI